MTETKTILIIGRTGRGKSTLANVITGAENKFKESSGSASQTREIQFEEFKDEKNDIKYVVIDTPGIGDTKFPDSRILDIISEAVYLVKDGLNQVFFVIDGRFDQYEMITYNLLRETIFDKDIAKHTTITRTRFDDFEDEEKCQGDIDLMIKEAEDKKDELKSDIDNKKKEIEKLSANSGEYKELLEGIKKLEKELKVINLAEIIESCRGKVIYVNNPPIEVADADEEELELNKEDRINSRKIVLNHLQKGYQEVPYKPKNLEKLSKEIVDYMRSKIELKEKLKRLENKETKIIDYRDSKVEDNKNKSEDTSLESNSKVGPVTKNKGQVEHNNNKNSVKIEEEIKKLESRKERLKKEIKAKEKIIRQKVLKHILNNYEDIDEIPGGDIFVDSIIGDNNNWEDINKEFSNKKLVGEWINCEFNYQQVQEWANVLENNFKPTDVYFYAWLKNNKQLTPKEVLSVSIGKLKDKYFDQLKKETIILDSHNQQLSQLEGINIAQYFRQYFDKWTSGNGEIDKLIQQHQLKATNYAQILEWIPYEKFINIEYLAEGGFSKLYKAKWTDGPIEKWNSENNNWERYPEVVTLKSLNNSRDMEVNFLQEIIYNKLFDKNDLIVQLYGISQDPETKNYLMVTQYMEEGNLREYLDNNYSKLNFEDKLFRLQNIAFGLYSIHKQNLVHQDLHPGNILNDVNYSYISDLGLSRLVNETNKGKNYGVLSYVAPEVLQGRPYTQAADIYSWSMIAYEMLTWMSPYHDRPNDNMSLVLEICEGLRPQFQIKVPLSLEDLTRKCWDADPKKRPTASELSRILGDWYNEIENKNSEFYRQVQEAEEFNRTLPDHIRFPNKYKHSDQMYTSKIIDTKELLRKLQISKSIPITADLSELKIPEEHTNQEAQIEIPPKNN